MRHILRKFVGFALFFSGIVMSIPVLVPGWGLPVIVAGLAVLAPEYEWARRLHRKAYGMYRQILDKMKIKKSEGPKS